MGIRIFGRQARREVGEEERRRFFRPRASDILALIAEGGEREHVPYGCFVNHWDWCPDDREAMMADPPVSDSYEDLCRIAAVVHALCHREAIPVPDWALQYRSQRPLLLSPSMEELTSPGDPLWQRIADVTPCVWSTCCVSSLSSIAGRRRIMIMAGRRHTPEQIVRKLREADRLLAEGAGIADVARHLEVSEQTFHRWRNQYGAMGADDVKRLKALEAENARLKRIVADKELEIDALREISRGKW